jgi:thiamine biosynthesis lipoprotein
VLERVERFDAVWSRFRPDSVVAEIAAAENGGVFAFPAEAVTLFELFDRLSAATAGAVDPLVGRQLELLGYDSTYSLVPAPEDIRQRAVQQRPDWAADVVREGATLVTRRPLVVDVGAAGKGLLVDLIAVLLEESGVAEFVIDASGDLRHRGASAVRIGLEHPLDPRSVIGVVELQNGSLCASATNRRAWGDGLHHVLDARTGEPVSGVLATWVLAADAATADGLATALFTTDPRRLRQSFRFSHVRLFADGRAERSARFPGELFTRPAPPDSR